jgi:CPA1 family monovalent cation:H+ antiporter
MILSLLEPFLQEHSELIELELALVILLSLAAVVAIVIRRARLPYTVALVLVGLILSFFPNLLNIDVSSELILSLLVPPLIFEATLNLRWSKLRQDLLPILLLALVGTLASSFIVAGIVGFLGEALLPDLDLPFAAVFGLGARI